MKKAVKIVGSQSALAEAIGATRQQVWRMLDTGQVPPSRCKSIEKATNGAVPAEQLRPDIFKVA